ncbi:MAG: hypothetical protein M1834_008752 [Cirrosporium novae-zelandiae]|nr:MAG: hypothetical protein M1834_008752 [Cirrosporium novae-zelandiae]
MVMLLTDETTKEGTDADKLEVTRTIEELVELIVVLLLWELVNSESVGILGAPPEDKDVAVDNVRFPDANDSIVVPVIVVEDEVEASGSVTFGRIDGNVGGIKYGVDKASELLGGVSEGTKLPPKETTIEENDSEGVVVYSVPFVAGESSELVEEETLIDNKLMIEEPLLMAEVLVTRETSEVIEEEKVFISTLANVSWVNGEALELVSSITGEAVINGMVVSSMHPNNGDMARLSSTQGICDANCELVEDVENGTLKFCKEIVNSWLIEAWADENADGPIDDADTKVSGQTTDENVLDAVLVGLNTEGCPLDVDAACNPLARMVELLFLCKLGAVERRTAIEAVLPTEAFRRLLDVGSITPVVEAVSLLAGMVEFEPRLIDIIVGVVTSPVRNRVTDPSPRYEETTLRERLVFDAELVSRKKVGRFEMTVPPVLPKTEELLNEVAICKDGTYESAVSEPDEL